jgi:UDP-glucose 6-dehydrogenase
VVDEVRSVVGPARTVAILGLAYRSGTDVLDESPGIALAEALRGDGTDVVAYDPLVGEAAVRLATDVKTAKSLEHCVENADVVVIAMPWPALVGELPRLIAASPSVTTVIDAWRSIEPSTLPDGCGYVALGVAGEPPIA